MLERMYLRYCERRGYKVEVLEESDWCLVAICLPVHPFPALKKTYKSLAIYMCYQL